ncbi:MAG: transglutaminase [Desulfuromonas sp.]|nr:MAG: transglutaminase [Desulfuromonas sp.]
MKFRVTHTTEYDYTGQVSLCWNRAVLLPRDTATQKCLTSGLQIDPMPTDLHERTDFFGNRISHFAIQEPHGKLKVTAVSDLAISSETGYSAADNGSSWESVRDQLSSEKKQDVLAALPCRFRSKLVHGSQQLTEYARPSFTPERPLLEAVTDLMRRIYEDFKYDPGVTTISTPLIDVLKNRHGVCQDFAHLGIGCLRAMGLAARYVSGYIETVPPPGKEKMVGADASHAWFSVFAGTAGWIDFDPTNNQIPSGQHVTVAWGRDFSDVSPLRGVALGGGKHKVAVSVDVARLST